MAFKTRTGVPFAFGLLVGTLIALFLSVQQSSDITSAGCESSTGAQPSIDNRRYVYAARDWRVERRPVAAGGERTTAAKVVRSRFAATELGIRERLVVLIFGQSALSGALSALLTPHVSRVQIFMEASRVDSETGALPNLTPYRQNGQHTHVHVLNSVFNLRSYVNPFALRRLIDGLSWGVARAVGRRAADGKCRFEAGVLLSNPSVQLLIQYFCRADWLLLHFVLFRQRHLCGSIMAGSDQAAFEMCVQQATNLTCSENEPSSDPFCWWHFEDGGEAGTAIHERVSSLRHSSAFNESVTVSPLLSELDARALHAHFVDVEMARVTAQIDAITAGLRADEMMYSMRRAEDKSTRDETLADNEDDGRSWPIGMPHAIKSTNRYQVPVWDYFTATHLYRNWPNSNVRRLVGEDALDVAEVTAAARAKLEKSGDGARFLRLSGGYRVFNALRGMEYVVDLEYEGLSDDAPILQRVHLCRPIAASELVESVPYVKEDTDITVVIPVESEDDVYAVRRLLACQMRLCSAEGTVGDKRQTRFVVAARRVDTTIAHQLNEDLTALKRICKTWNVETALLALKKPVGGAGRLFSLRVAAIAEAVDHYGQQTIFALISPYTDYQREFLDRIRISTIRRFQVFAPIPFAEFNPLVSRADEILRHATGTLRFDEAVGDEPRDVSLAVQILRSAAKNLSAIDEWPLVVHKDRGFFDTDDFSVFSVYGADFSLMQERFVSHQNDGKTIDGEGNQTFARQPVDVEDLILLAQDQIHVLRAVEPSLRSRYHERKCESADWRCAIAARATLGTKAQMANFTFRALCASSVNVPLLLLQPSSLS